MNVGAAMDDRENEEQCREIVSGTQTKSKGGVDGTAEGSSFRAACMLDYICGSLAHA